MRQTNKKKKIAIIHQSMVMGGTEQALLDLLSMLDYSLYEVHLWLKDDSGELFSRIDHRAQVFFWGNCKARNWKEQTTEEWRKGKPFTAARHLICRALSKLFVRRYFPNYVFFLKSLYPLGGIRYDAAICYSVFDPERAILLAYGFQARRKIGGIHMMIPINPGKYYDPLKPAYRKIDRFFCVSNAARQRFVSVYPQYESRVDLVYNPISQERVKNLSRERIEEFPGAATIVSVGRLSKEKGFDLVPKAARLLRDSGCVFQWLVIGDGLEKASIEEEIGRNGVEDCVRLLGTRDNPYPYVARCAVYVQPSRSEGFCLAVMEAALLHKPIVSTEIPAVEEVLGKKRVMLCSPDADALAERIRSVLDGNGSAKLPAFSAESYNRAQMGAFCTLLEK